MFDLKNINSIQRGELVTFISMNMLELKMSFLIFPKRNANNELWAKIGSFIKEKFNIVESDVYKSNQLIHAWWENDRYQFRSDIQTKISFLNNNKNNYSIVINMVKESIKISDWQNYKNTLMIGNTRKKFGASFFNYVKNILKKKVGCKSFHECYNGFSKNNLFWKGTYKCTNCSCEFNITLDETQKNESSNSLDLNIGIGDSKCDSLEDRLSDDNESYSSNLKIELYCKKQNKYIDVNSFSTMLKTNCAQVLSKSLICDGLKLKGFLHNSSVKPYGYLLQSDIQVLK